MEDHSASALDTARALRGAMSLPEVLLWRQLKLKPNGLKFRRQHPIGNYVVDFYCAAKRMAVEIDGIAHDMGSRPERDAMRDAVLREMGVTVVRIPATDVLNDEIGIAEALAAACAAVPPPTALRAATSPNGGGSLGVL